VIQASGRIHPSKLAHKEMVKYVSHVKHFRIESV
jgi:hypothetical protein